MLEIKHIFTLVLLISCFSTANAGDERASKRSDIPVLLFSDLTQAPPGAFVTLWGQNISKDTLLKCGNKPCEIVLFEEDPYYTTRKNMSPRQRIVVRFRTGEGISIDGSNSLPFKITDGRIHTLSPGPINFEHVKKGDIVYLRGGIYDVPRGGSINSIILPKNDIAVIAYPGERVIIDCHSASAVNTYSPSKFLRNFTVAKLEMDCRGSNRTVAIKAIWSKKENLRVVGNFVHDARSGISGALGEFSNTEGLYVLGNRIDNTGIAGKNNAHAIYHGGRGKSRNVNINYNTITNHLGGRAIQVYGHEEGESLRELHIIGNVISGVTGNAAILISSSDAPKGVSWRDPRKGWVKDATIEKNIIDNVDGAGIDIRNSGVKVQIRDNIIHNARQSIVVYMAQSAAITGNCLDRPLQSDISIVKENNKTNYPDCLEDKK